MDRCFAAILCLLPLVVSAGDLMESKADNVVETFIPPEPTDVSPPKYPRSKQRLGQEGWVAVNFMVDTQGSPYDITINNSSGGEAFERAAIRAIERWRYEPALFQGDAIDAGTYMHLTFQLRGNAGASPAFVKSWKRYHRAREEKNAAAEAAEFTKLEERQRNLYEEAFYQLVLSERFRAAGQTEAEYQSVARAAYVDRGKGFLPDAMLTGVLTRKMYLELETNRLARANQTIASLRKREIDSELTQQLDEIEVAIASARQADGVIKSKGRIRNDNRYVHNLLKSTFALEGIEGDIAEARLHCDKGYVGFIYHEDMSYTVQKDWSNCALILIGNPKTTFVVVER